MASGLMHNLQDNTLQCGSTNGSHKHGIMEKRSYPEKENHELVLASFRCLVADIVQQFDGGHPG
jgi:hypothetical protein